MRKYFNQKAQGMTEYAIILGLVVAILAVVISQSNFGDSLKGTMASITGQVEQVSAVPLDQKLSSMISIIHQDLTGASDKPSNIGSNKTIYDWIMTHTGVDSETNSNNHKGSIIGEYIVAHLATQLGDKVNDNNSWTITPNKNGTYNIYVVDQKLTMSDVGSSMTATKYVYDQNGNAVSSSSVNVAIASNTHEWGDSPYPTIVQQ